MMTSWAVKRLCDAGISVLGRRNPGRLGLLSGMFTDGPNSCPFRGFGSVGPRRGRRFFNDSGGIHAVTDEVCGAHHTDDTHAGDTRMTDVYDNRDAENRNAPDMIDVAAHDRIDDHPGYNDVRTRARRGHPSCMFPR